MVCGSILMVWYHHCFAGEALGAIGSKESLELLEKYTTDPIVEVTVILGNLYSEQLT